MIADLKPTARSAKTNGKAAFLGQVDGRTALARRQRDLERAFAAELGDDLSAAERLRCAQAACLSVRAEVLQAAVARGDADVSDEDLVRVTNALGRELAALEAIAARRNTKREPTLAEQLMADRRAREGGQEAA